MKQALTLVLLLAAAATAGAQDVATGGRDDASLLSRFESRWQKAAEAAESVVVSLVVERAESRKPARRTPGGNSMLTGGVFAVAPEETRYACGEHDGLVESEGKCESCEGELKKRFVTLATGTIVGADGYVGTTYFNIAGAARITAVLPDGRKLSARSLGYHMGGDVALLKIEARDLPVLKASNLGQLKVGNPVVALGRAPDGKGITLNPGIVSAPARLSGLGVQFDGKMNYGNVGGPLVDLDGRLVGITCKVDVKYAANFGQNSGVSFALTQDQLGKLMPDLIAGKRVQGTGQAFMGIMADQTAEDVDGVLLADVIKDGGAEKAGVRKGDIIIEFDGQKITQFDQLRTAIIRKQVNDPFSVKVRRGDEILELNGTLGERPMD